MNRLRVITALGLVLVGAALVWSFRPSTENSLNTIRVAQWGKERYLIYLPLYVAIDEGLLKERGYEVELQFTGNDDQTFAAVASRAADVGIGDPAFAAIAKERGFPAKVIATVVGRVAIWGVSKNPNISRMEKPEDLAGLRVGTFPEPSTNFSLMRALVERLKETPNPPQIVQAPIGAQLALLEGGSVDVAMELEPGAAIAEENGYRVVFSSPSMHGDFAFTGVTTTANNLIHSREALQAFVLSLEEAVRLCHSNPEIAIRVAEKQFPNLPKGTVRRAVERMLNEQTLPTTVRVNLKGWTQAVKLRASIGQLEDVEAAMTVVTNELFED